MKKSSNISGFSMVEVMISIFIFSLWIASIFMVINSSININILNKNVIIASNLSRESIEIIRNIRDYNYKTYHNYNWIPNSTNDFKKNLVIWKYYKIENDFSSSEYPFKISSSWNQIFTNNSKKDFIDWKFDDYKLCIKKDTNIYSHSCTSDDKEIKVYRYLYLEELKDESWVVIPDAIKLKSKVVWYSKWYHEFEINTVLTDFNRL